MRARQAASRAGAVWWLIGIAWLLAGPAAADSRALEFQHQRLTVGRYQFEVRLPRGYRLEILSSEFSRPRLLAFAPDGALFIGSHAARVYRVPPPYTHPEVYAELSDYPHSVAFRRGEILIARTSGVYRAPWRRGQRRLAPGTLKLLARLPPGGGHNSRTVGVGPDRRVYASLGISGNCANQYLDAGYAFEDRRGGVMVLDENATPPRFVPFASGLRNPVGFDWQPATGILYASNNGPDHLGFDQPPEYFSRLEAGSFHGMPWYQFDGNRLRRDPCIDAPPPRDDPRPPVATFPARNAPMGVAFVPRGALDPRFEGDAIVALHGSWGTAPGGGPWGDPATRRPPKLVAVRFAAGRAVRVDDLITGFQLRDGKRWARPIGVAIGPDGALYFTSDAGLNALFRLRRVAD